MLAAVDRDSRGIGSPYLCLQDTLWTQRQGKGDSALRSATEEQLRARGRINAHYKQRQLPLGYMDPRPVDYQHTEVCTFWCPILDAMVPGPLPTWHSPHGPGNRDRVWKPHEVVVPPTDSPLGRPDIAPPACYWPRAAQLKEVGASRTQMPIRMLMAIPAWYVFRSLRGTIDRFRMDSPSLSAVSGAYKHYRRRCWDRNRRCLAMVFFIPDVFRLWIDWRVRASDLVQLRATCTRACKAVRHAEERHGDILATLVAGGWMALVACHIAEVEDDLWYDWSEELQKGRCLGSLWEFERDSYGEKTIWGFYDERSNFPSAEDPGGLARDIMAEMHAEFCTSEEEEETPPTSGPPPGSPFPRQPGPVLARATRAAEIPRTAWTSHPQTQTTPKSGFPARAPPGPAGPSHLSAPGTLATGVPTGPPRRGSGYRHIPLASKDPRTSATTNQASTTSTEAIFAPQGTFEGRCRIQGTIFRYRITCLIGHRGQVQQPARRHGNLGHHGRGS